MIGGRQLVVSSIFEAGLLGAAVAYTYRQPNAVLCI